MKKMLTTLLIVGSLLTGVPGLSQAAPPAPAAANTLSPQDRADLLRLDSAAPSLLQQRAGDAVLVVSDRGRGRWHDGYDGYYGYGIGSLILTAIIVSVIIVSQQPYR
ncbi:MAG TPA: hypothetical protein VNZ67_15480 [bacterium]|nr:hypothetical protein [bacterium]